MTALDIQNLGKNFGQVRALRDFTLSISEGEFVSLLGPSGCGKTTTLRCVAGFEFPDQGRILFGEHDMTWMPPEQRDVGMVFQSYALFPHLTVRENLAFGLEMRKTPSTESHRRITEVLEMVQLTGMDQRFPRELSGGQQQRVALARALVIEPSLLLLDEPLANLDASLRGDMRFFIRDLQQRVGITSIYVTHDQSEAIVMSDRIVVMFDGAIAQVGTPKDIHDRPATMQVAEFVGRSNFIGGKIKGANKDHFRRIETEYGEFVAVGPAEYKAGARANLMIRPENIRLGKGEKDWNKLSGTVSSAIYIGDSINLEVRLSDNLSVQITARPDCSAVPGEALDFSFPPDNCWLLA
ncbi:MAG: ABC transporter ATP-binding protein [Fimbriimonadaceae bacterium]|nr:ABC transporter ATP-binding protein [Alphaproteobacteria bacterium]